MSHDVHLSDPLTGSTIELEKEHHHIGGTYCMGGTKQLWLNVTYNYGAILHRVIGKGGITSLYGKTGKETIPLIENAITLLKDDVNPDYWEPTEGNVKTCLKSLLEFAKLAPQGIWGGD